MSDVVRSSKPQHLNITRAVGRRKSFLLLVVGTSAQRYLADHCKATWHKVVITSANQGLLGRWLGTVTPARCPIEDNPRFAAHRRSGS